MIPVCREVTVGADSANPGPVPGPSDSDHANDPPRTMRIWRQSPFGIGARVDRVLVVVACPISTDARGIRQ